MNLDGITQRRIITGHDATGLAIFLDDEQLLPAPLREDTQTEGAFFNAWVTDAMPVDNTTDESLAVQRAGSETTFLGTGEGTVLRVGILAAGTRSPLHRTQSIDYAICLEGSCDLELDNGVVRTVNAGDIVIQRGTNHVWHNRSGAPCRFAWILVDAQPIATASGAALDSVWVDDRTAD